MKIFNSLADLLFSDELRSAMRHSMVWYGKFTANAVDEVFSWKKLNEILFLQRMDEGRIRLSRRDEPLRQFGKAFSQVVDKYGNAAGFLRLEVFNELLEDGATAVVESVNEASYFLNNISEKIFSCYRAKSSINAYMSFGMQDGFGVHYDDQDLIVVQIEGRKCWSFFGSDDCVHRNFSDSARPAEDEVSKQIILQRGDVLYVPKGVWHHVRALGDASLHLAIGLEYPSVGDFMHWVIEKKKSSLPCKSIRAFCAENEDLSAMMVDFFRRFCDAQQIQNYIDDYYSRVAAVRIRPDVANRFSVAKQDLLGCVPASFIKRCVDANSGLVDVRALGRRFKLSTDELNVLEGIFRSGSLSCPCALALLPAALTEGKKMQVLSSLLKMGLVTKISADGRLARRG